MADFNQEAAARVAEQDEAERRLRGILHGIADFFEGKRRIDIERNQLGGIKSLRMVEVAER